jgi:2-polyprenyl-3-methyl-5-hydroxy-6-metoxy-1,4-benzoquinol methylase
VVRKADPSLRRLVHLAAKLLRIQCVAILRTVITSVVFITCVMVMLHYLGVPVPGPSELLDKFEALGELSRILS